MKKIIIGLFVVFALFSCNDLLEMSPLDKISENDVWSDKSLIQSYVNASYNALNHGFNQEMFGSTCDEFYDHHNAGNYWIIQKGEITSDNVSDISSKLNIWSNAYSSIRNINVFFINIEKAAIDEGSKKEMTGEMKFIRAFLYSNLIWRYGGVPLITDVFELNEDYSVSKDTYDDLVTFICAELDEAILLLPDQQSGSDLGRASGDAAKALKARVLLYSASPLNNPSNDKSKWEKAASAAKALVDTRYSLHNNYQKLFLEKNNEIIFARYFSQANSNSLNGYCGRNADSGWGDSCPTQNMVNDYEMTNGELPYLNQDAITINPNSGYDPANPYINRDPRFAASILCDGSVWMGRETETFKGGLDSRESSIGSWNASLTGYYLKKFLQEEIPPSGSSTKPTAPWSYFRYGEILLNYAEAKFEVGDEDIAREYVNIVRSRESVNMPAITASGAELKEKIQHERRIELAFEEHRYFDVRRWNIAVVTERIDLSKMEIIKLADGSKTYEIQHLMGRTFHNQNYLLPIPRSEIDKSFGILEQNQGYD